MHWIRWRRRRRTKTRTGSVNGGLCECDRRLFTSLARHPGWVLEGDIRGCFDNISHEWLLAHAPMDRAILRKWLKPGYMEKHSLYATEQGMPQGGIISPVLANLALDGLERRFTGEVPAARPRIVARHPCSRSPDPVCRRLHHSRQIERTAGREVSLWLRASFANVDWNSRRRRRSSGM